VIVVAGLGPAGPELTTPAVREALTEAAHAGRLFLRTSRHPACEPYRDIDGVHSFDGAYERAASFAEVYEEIVTTLLDAAAPGAAGAAPIGAQARPVTYAVPGSPMLAERTVGLLRERAAAAGIPVEILAGLSFADLAWSRLGVDPIEAGVRLVDGESFTVQVAGDHGPFLVGQCWSRQVLSDIKLAIAEPADGQRATLLNHLGLGDEQVVDVAWEDLDRSLEPDHLTSLYIPHLGAAPMQELATFFATVERLRHDCPWDREQTHQSLIRHLLEETYEAIEAIEGLGESPATASVEQVAHAEEELGDLLCQVAFHTVLGAEEGLFTLADVARTVNDKLVARHPHVFGDVVAETAAAVVTNWERIKDQEKQRTHLFEGVPVAMPALARAAKAERKLASVGLGWPDAAVGLGVAATSGAPEREAGTASDLAGDALLALARRLASSGVDPEAALRQALGRLGQRVGQLEARARLELASDLADIDPATRRSWWDELPG
jgi:tetrapyrrole methylase family protein/MazG family protein